MNNTIHKIRLFRTYLLQQTETLSIEQLNLIPQGFNNNIIWNMAHLISAQQGVCYLRAGKAVRVEDHLLTPFLTNTKPEKFINAVEVAEIRARIITTLDELQTDYDAGHFSNYTPSPNILRVYGVELTSIDHALEFLLYHEGVHCGYIMAMKHLV